MQKDSEGKWKKTVNLSKEECGKLALMLKEISKGMRSVDQRLQELQTDNK